MSSTDPAHSDAHSTDDAHSTGPPPVRLTKMSSKAG